MTTAISIIGQGNMGQALARHFEQAGISVQIFGREQEVVQGSLLFLLFLMKI
ncbi:NAD(P)-binding domain-containing protein [Streptococcus pluranimalium]|uniref:NAD(P)-binding domain-containing protein n=1 Tax=Streptococcus pluranimalium TaxID=82348 RepID=UPI0039FDBD91